MPTRLLVPTVTAVLLATPALPGDWPEWRGPLRDGRSDERGLPERWSPAGEGLAWKAPYGARSTPVVLGDRLYIQSPAGQGETRQERVACLDANTGRLLWEHPFNVYLSDVPPHRVGWASPAADPATGNVYALGVGGHLLALSRDGKVLWERSLTEDFGLVTTHGGRTVSPVIEGDLVIVSGITSGWGDQARGAHRFMAFDKASGELAWVAAPGGRPFDTTYAPPIVAVVDGTRLLIAGGSDGSVHAMKPETGEVVWSIPISKHGLNTGAVLQGTTVFVSHSEENLESNEMGMLAAVEGTGKGTIGADHFKWKNLGFQGGFSSPVLDGSTLYQVDNGANLYAFDAVTGKTLWQKNLGTIQKASAVLADGKLYVGSNNGRFFILKPGPSGATVLDEDALGTESAPEEIWASVAVAHGRVYLATMDNLYAIGRKGALAKAAPPKSEPAATPGEPAFLQVRPAEVTLRPGATVRFHARLYDAQGRFVREEPAATWSLDGAQLKAEVKPTGELLAPEGPRPQAGVLKAAFGALTGTARVRVFPPPPGFVSFDWLDKVPAPWVNATGKFDLRAQDDGKVLVKLADNPFTKRARAFVGPSDMHDYTVAADVLAKEHRRQMGDGGVVAQRYALVLFGNNQKLELEPWQPEIKRTASAPFAWKADTWYRLKLRVENLPDGKVRARGKAWPAAEPEPEGWLLDRVDPIGNHQGSPGVYADAPYEVLFDNLSVVPNDEKLAAGRRDPALFEYDSRLPPDLKEVGVETKGAVKVRDVTYASLGGGRTAAYLVEGQGQGPHPAVLFVHWYEPHSPSSNRTQFVDEAVGLAGKGVTSLLVETPWSNPEWFEKRDAARDYETSVAEVKDLRRALDVLLAQPGVDKSRVAYVGHDFGAMYGAVLAGVDKRPQSFALQAGTGSFPDWFLYAPPRVGEVRKAFIQQMAALEPAAYTAAAAPAAVFFQFGTSDPHVFRERADAFYAMASEPKKIAFYEAGHGLNDAARKDRVAWLQERLKLGSN
jgi:outer membrane protein assembly factor BamB/dienelactone hydrolase